MSRAELDRAFNNPAMKKRLHRLAILAMPLSSLFDITQPTDFLHSALNMFTEYEQYCKRRTGIAPKCYLLSAPLETATTTVYGCGQLFPRHARPQHILHNLTHALPA